MHSILKPYQNLLNPGKLQVPTGQLTIDWLHPLANGLIGCWLPGNGSQNITGISPPLTVDTAANFNIGADGVGLYANAAHSGMYQTAAAPFVASTTVYTYYIRAYVVATPGAVGAVGFTDWLGVSYSNTATAPFYYLSMGWATTPPTWRINSNTAGSFSSFDMTDANVAAGKIISCGLTRTAGNPINATSTIKAYSNGLNIVTNTAFTFDATFSATARINLNTYGGDLTRFTDLIMFCAYIWNRVLSDDEMAWINLEPYSFLSPAEYELPTLFPAGAQIYMVDQAAAHFTRRIQPIAY